MIRFLIVGGVGLALAALAALATADGGRERPVATTVSGLVQALSQVSGPLAGSVDQLDYQIRTKYDTGNGLCAVERVTPASLGVPKLVDMGGSSLPDLLVTVTAAPGVGGGPSVLQLTATLVGTHVHGLVEAIVAPAAGAPARLAVGYDGCETGVPTAFSATLTATATRLSVATTTATTLPSLTVLGSTFDAVGTTRANPTSMAARLAPVPASLTAVVDILGPSSYQAHVETSSPTAMRIDYADVDGGNRTSATSTIDKFPGVLDLTFNESVIEYDASAPMNAVGVALEIVKPAPARTTQLDVTLLGVPTTARLERSGPTHVTFTTPGTIGTTTVRFASFDPGTVLPALPVGVGTQYLVANVTPHYSAAQVRLLGLSDAEVDAGDPVLVRAEHRPGPFHVLATTSALRTAPPLITETRNLALHVLDLPSTATITYSPSTQAFSYDGSAIIGLLTADVTSNVPFVDDATTSHLRIEEFPTGLTGRLNSEAKTFDATLTGGALRLLEVQVTSGADERLPEGVQGILLEDHARLPDPDRSYVAFVRVLGLQRASVAWGDTKVADVTHTPGPFVLNVDTDDVDTDDIEINGLLADLPATAYFEYTPKKEIEQCATPPCTTPMFMSYTGSDVVGRLTLDVVSGEPLFDRADEVHVRIWNIPTHFDLTVDGAAKHASGSSSGAGDDFLVDVQACSSGDCPPSPIGEDGAVPPAWLLEPDGIWLAERTDSYHVHLRVTGLVELGLNWGDPVIVDAVKSAKAFDIYRIVDRVRVDQPEYGAACSREEDFGNGCDPCNPFTVPSPPNGGCPEPPVATEFPYVATLDVKIRDLPADVYFEYSAATQSIIYEGSDVLDLITADVLDPGVPIMSRAHEAHLRVEGLPVDIRLTFATGGAHDVLSACAGEIDAAGVCHPTGQIDLVALTFLGAPETMPVLEGTPLRGDIPFDGLVYVDRHDDDSDTHDPIDDAFAIEARVRDLRSFTFTDTATSSPHTCQSGCSRRRDLAGDLDRGNRHSLWVEMVKEEESFILDYETPPHQMGFDLSVFSNDRGRSSVDFEYAGSEVGTRAMVTTNIGSMEELHLVFTGLPAGAPAIDFCVMNGDLGCAPETVCYADSYTPCGPTQDCSSAGVDCVAIDLPDDSYNEFSMSLDATGPISVNGHYIQDDDMQLLLGNVSIDNGLTLAKFTRTRDFFEGHIDSNVVYADTHGGTIAGTIRLRHTNWTGTTDRAVYAVFPTGVDRFYAIQRYVEIETAGVNGSRNWGQAHCPSGTELEAESTGVDFDVSDDICREP